MNLRTLGLKGVWRAVRELLLARLILARDTPSELRGHLSISAHQLVDSKGVIPEDVKQVGYLIPRVAARMPWRADCLVQALAARRWLAKLGYETELSLGTRKTAGRFEAHAWLKWHDFVVTGGNIEEYVKLSGGDGLAREL